MKPSSGKSRVRAINQRAWMSVVALGVGASLWMLPSPGEAQVALRTAQPSVSAHLGSAPEQVRLGFSQAPASEARAKVMVLSPEDDNLALGPASTSLAGVSQRVAALRESGAYQVSYEVPLADGSVSRGAYWFWYAPNASGSLAWLQSPVLPGIALLGFAAALVAIGRRRRTLDLVPTQHPAAIRGVTASPVTASPVPMQRRPRDHEGASPSGRRPRPDPAPERLPERQNTDRPC